MLICEIEKMNDSDQENRKEIIQIIGTLAKYVIVIPISFFAGFIFKDGETIKAELLFQIILICIIVFCIFLGFVIMNASSFQYFFTSGKKKREMVLSRLLDIQYLYKYENQERT